MALYDGSAAAIQIVRDLEDKKTKEVFDHIEQWNYDNNAMYRVLVDSAKKKPRKNKV